LRNDLGIEGLLALKVPVEAAVRQASGRHDLANRHLRETLAVEEPGGGFEDPLARVLLMLC
jgi:hypothetical protein